MGGMCGVLFAEYSLRLFGYQSNTIDELNWVHFVAGITGAVPGIYLGFLVNKECQKNNVPK